MDKQTEKTEASNSNTKTKEDKMKGTFTDLTIKDIRKHIRKGYTIHEYDLMALDIVADVPLAELVKGHKSEITIGNRKLTVPTLSIMKNVIVLGHPTEQTKSGNKKTLSFHLWENSDWMNVLDEVGMVVRIKKPNMKKGVWALMDAMDPEDLTYLVRTPQGATMSDTGYHIPSIGGLNFKTGEIENVPNEPITVNRTELFHKWHDQQIRVDSGTTASDSKEIAYATKKMEEAKIAGNKKAESKWAGIISHYRSL